MCFYMFFHQRYQYYPFNLHLTGACCIETSACKEKPGFSHFSHTGLLVMNLTINRTGLVMCVPILVVVYLCLSVCTNVCLCEHVCLCVQLFVFVNMFVIVNEYLPIGSLPAREYLVREIST